MWLLRFLDNGRLVQWRVSEPLLSVRYPGYGDRVLGPAHSFHWGHASADPVYPPTGTLLSFVTVTNVEVMKLPWSKRILMPANFTESTLAPIVFVVCVRVGVVSIGVVGSPFLHPIQYVSKHSWNTTRIRHVRPIPNSLATVK